MSKTTNYSTSHLVTILFAREGDDAAAIAAAAAAKATADAAIQKQIDDAVAAATTGLKAKNDELLGKMKVASDRVKAFDGLDPAALKELKDRLDQDEDAKLLAEGKKNVVIEKYTERMRAQHKLDMDAKDAAIKAEAEKANAYRGSVLDNHIRAVTTGLHKGAVEDALLHARQIFQLDAKGNAVQLDTDGRPVLGKDGTTPFTPAEWIELQKELKPHWFPAGTSGSGSGNARDAGGAGKSMKRADFDRLPANEKAATVRTGIKIVD